MKRLIILVICILFLTPVASVKAEVPPPPGSNWPYTIDSEESFANLSNANTLSPNRTR